MKKWLLLELISLLKQRRKLKVFLASMALILLFITGLTIWGGVATYNYLAAKVDSSQIQSRVLSIKENVLSPFCIGKVKSLLSIEAWAQAQVSENLQNLKTACLDEANFPCPGENCKEFKELINTAKEMETI